MRNERHARWRELTRRFLPYAVVLALVIFGFGLFRALSGTKQAAEREVVQRVERVNELSEIRAYYGHARVVVTRRDACLSNNVLRRRLRVIIQPPSMESGPGAAYYREHPDEFQLAVAGTRKLRQGFQRHRCNRRYRLPPKPRALRERLDP